MRIAQTSVSPKSLAMRYFTTHEPPSTSRMLPGWRPKITAYRSSSGVTAKILGKYDISRISAKLVLADEDDDEGDGDDAFDPKQFKRLVKANNTNEGGLQEQLLEVIHGRWNKNPTWTLVAAKRADRFFGPMQVIYTGLRYVNKKYVLVFSKNRSKAESGQLI